MIFLSALNVQLNITIPDIKIIIIINILILLNILTMLFQQSSPFGKYAACNIDDVNEILVVSSNNWAILIKPYQQLNANTQFYYNLLQFQIDIQEMSEPSKLKSTITTQTDEWGRKKYRIQEKSESQEEEQAQTVEANAQKSLLVGREQDLNIEKYIGRIEKNKKSKKKEVFYCEVCKEGFKCDMAYITHLNSPHHNRKLGMSMKVKAVSKDAVIEKLNSMKNGKPMSAEEREMARFHQNAFVKKNDRLKEEQQKLEQDEQDKALQGNEEEEQEDDVEAQMRALGLPTSFGSKKQKR